MLGIWYIFLTILWMITFLLLFTKQKPSKFTVGCAYVIVIIVFIEKAIEHL